MPKISISSTPTSSPRTNSPSPWKTLKSPGFPLDACREIAERINTGASDPETSRALVVFNLTDEPRSGIAVFHADMSWPKNLPLPPVVISELGGHAVASALMELREGPDRKGRAGHILLTFDLRFVVHDVPAQGWRTYIAAYADTPTADALETLTPMSPDLLVIETLRHDGDLPPVTEME